MVKPEFEQYLKTLQTLERLSGVSLSEAHKILGYEYGRRLASNLKSNNIFDLLNEVSLLLEQNDLGHTEIEKTDPIKLTVHRCLGCEWIPDAVSSISTCPLREGLLESILHEKLNVKVKVTSISTGSAYGEKVCKFEVHLIKE
ncbi:MAG: hypothetical protein ACP5GU_06340 [Thermoprotei archaeon]